MNYKIIAIIGGALCALCFCGGRYSKKPQIVEKTKVVTVEKEIVKHETKYITIVKKPDGSVVTKITDKKDSQTDLTKNVTDKIKLDSSGYKSNLSLLVGVQPKLFGGSDLGPLAIGASWTTQPVSFLPFTLGLWGIVTTPAIGASVGWNY